MTSFEAQSGEPKRTREALQGAWGVQAEEAPAPGVLIAAGVDRAPQSGLGEAEGCAVPDSDTGLLRAEKARPGHKVAAALLPLTMRLHDSQSCNRKI